MFTAVRSLGVTGLFILLAGCSPGQEQPSQTVIPTTPPVMPRSIPVAGADVGDASQPTPLQPEEPRVFGSPRPEGLTLVSHDEDIARFTTGHEIRQVIDFFRRELRGYEVEIEADGARFETVNPQQADIYLVRASDGLVHVAYFRSGLEDEFEAAFHEEMTQQETETENLPFAERFPWLQGYTAPQALIEQAEETRSQERLNEYYQEHVEQRDGQAVRVLVVRDPSLPVVEQEPASAEEFLPTGPHIGPRGSYWRGEGHHSLRRNPARGVDGQVLPFFGTRRVEVSTTVPH